MTSSPPIPPDTRAAGQSDHIVDHNQISDALSWLVTETGLLGAQANGALILPDLQPGSYLLSASDLGMAVEISSAGPSVVTVPPSSQVSFPLGAVVWIVQAGTGSVTVAPSAGVTIVSASGYLELTGQYSEAKLRQRTLNSWILSGSLT